MAKHERKWWKDGVVYQVYPSSFKDTNGDGLGDLPGIISKLDYIHDLGIDILWISPMYDSPQVDMGYDISNYENVYPPFGTLQDMDTLIKEAHARGIRILLDLVINHTSDQHAWFKESRSSKDNPKRDWYMWRPARYDEEGNRIAPNNWRSNFSQPAWTWDETTQEYYLHLFCPEQPDLNWENPETRTAIYASSMDFWLKKGVDGFRVDTVNMYSKGDLADAPVTDPNNFHQPAGDMYCNGPRMHEFLREMQKESFDKYGDVMTVGELPNTKERAKVLEYVSYADRQLSMVFDFDVVDLGTGGVVGKPKFEYQPWTLAQFKDIWKNLQQFTTGTDGWATAFLENHDQGRSVSRFATEEPQWRALAAKMLATMLATMSGTLFVYQGQEIGMVNAPADWPTENYLDIDTQNYITFMQDALDKDPTAIESVKKSLHILARDHARLPVQWDDTPNAGFSTGDAKPWMKVNDNYKEINVANQISDSESVLSYWKEMLKIRKENPDLFTYGEFELLDPEDKQTFCFVKRKEGDKTSKGPAALIALNFSSEEQVIPGAGFGEKSLQFLVGNYKGKPSVDEKLRPWEGRVYLSE